MHIPNSERTDYEMHDFIEKVSVGMIENESATPPMEYFNC